MLAARGRAAPPPSNTNWCQYATMKALSTCTLTKPQHHNTHDWLLCLFLLFFLWWDDDDNVRLKTGGCHHNTTRAATAATNRSIQSQLLLSLFLQAKNSNTTIHLINCCFHLLNFRHRRDDNGRLNFQHRAAATKQWRQHVDKEAFVLAILSSPPPAKRKTQ